MNTSRARPPLAATLAALAVAATLFGIVVGALVLSLGLADQSSSSVSVWAVFFALTGGVIAAIVAAVIAAIVGLPGALLAHLALRRIGTGPLGISVSSLIAMAGCCGALLVVNFDGVDRSIEGLLPGPGDWLTPLLIIAAGVATVASWLILRRPRPSGIPA